MVLVVVSGLVVVGGTMANCGFVGGTFLWLFLLVGVLVVLVVAVAACLTGFFFSLFGVLLNFFFAFSSLLQLFRFFTFSFSNLFFNLVNFEMKISF